MLVTFADTGGSPSATSTGKEMSVPPPARAFTAPAAKPAPPANTSWSGVIAPTVPSPPEQWHAVRRFAEPGNPERPDQAIPTMRQVEPILHLSLPACDLAEAIDFYVESLGCGLGRVRPDFADVWFFGMQVTLHDAPEQVRAPDPGAVHHFGVTLSAPDMDALVVRAEARGAVFVSPVSTDFPGTPQEQTKTKLLDPSGNAIEIKTYVDPATALARDPTE